MPAPSEEEEGEKERLFWHSFVHSWGGTRMREAFNERRAHALSELKNAEPTDIVTIARSQAILTILDDTELFPWERDYDV